MQKRILILITLMLTGCVPALVNPVAQKPVVNPVITSSVNTNVQESIIPKPTQTATPTPVGTPINSTNDSTNVIPTNCKDPVFPSPAPSFDPAIPRPRYDINNSIKEPAFREKAIISIVFRDCAKVRYYSISNQFVSKAGLDIVEINKLVKDNNILVEAGVDMSNVKAESFGMFIREDDFEKYLEENERTIESLTETNQPNRASIYEFRGTNINIIDLISKLRKNPLVLSANESFDPIPA